MTLAAISLTAKDAASSKVGALVVGVAAGRKGPELLGRDDMPRGLRALLEGVLAPLRVDGSPGVTVVPSGGQTTAPLIALTGLGGRPGRGAPFDAEVLRRASGAAVRRLAGTRSVAIALPLADAEATGAVAEGALLGSYAFSRYRSADPDRPEPVQELSLVVPSTRDREVKAALARAQVLAAAVASTRDLVNTPPVDLYPEVFAAHARDVTSSLPVDVTVLDEKQLAKGGYGGLIGVGQGSVRPPRLVKLSYDPGRTDHHLALVGKGITFDSGGLSIKPAQGMQTMKLDMAGAAAVLATVVAAAEQKLPVRITGWLALAENMPSGTAQRPSDVITCFGGRTVEVLNTDAEGRLVLADAIAAASREDPDVIVDVATLTGAQQVALGNRISAVMANDDELRAAVVAAGDRTGEQMWPMPLPIELRASMDSKVADIANIGDRMGGMLVAGLFLQEFVGSRKARRGQDSGEPIRWAHIDIAGPSFNTGEAHGYTGKGGTGVAVRTLFGLAEDFAGR